MSDRHLPLFVLLIAAAAAANGDPPKRDGFLSRLASQATGAVVDIVDPEKIVEQIDVNALMERVDINELLSRVDVNELMERVDVNELLGRVDVNELMDRVDVNQLLDRVDVNHLMDRIDVNHLMDRVDVKALTDRAGIPDIVAESTGALAGSAMDVVRRQIVSLDQIVGRFAYRLTGHDPQTRPVAPPLLEGKARTAKDGRAQVTGHYAGPVSRLSAFGLDSIVVWLAFILFIFGLDVVLSLVFGADISVTWQQTVLGVFVFVSWAFVDFWVGFALAGKTVGMGVVGIGVLNRQGTTIPGRNAFIRTLVFPFSFLVFGLGFLGIFISPTRRAMHDAAAGTVVVYDWGDRPAEMNAPLTKWVNRHADDHPAPKAGVATDTAAESDQKPPADTRASKD
ncbi:MAG: RDD family protein [Acidimicrobiia bacterium]